ncbi:MAG: hypothetical protein EU530_10850 [Promethearchaeota archaeon]|nr:MAG: hypothetical protein EU530_10850 [Candidatus Lokiarchaeota archaeon]
MTQVTMDRDLAEDLVNSKLRIIVGEIDKILQKWNYKSIQGFLSDSRSGKIRDAEDDAIVIRNLMDDKEELLEIKKNW